MAHISEQGLSHIKVMEGLSLQAYADTGGVWTVGYGHTGPDVYMGLEITDERADWLLRGDVEKFERGVENLLAVPAEQEEFDAMVALAYNIGLGAFERSTLLAKHNAGNHAGAADEFGKWTKVGDEDLPGLVKRREREAALYRLGGRAG